VCIGAYGEQIGLPMVGRLADVWNSSLQGNEERWLRKRDIMRTAAEKAGRDPQSIEISLTIERSLPTSDSESQQFVEDLMHLRELDACHFVMDFGHPKSTEPVLRFVEQVMQPISGK
jgi:alkanesulfonate monooxygenase SsuD/methylene tetrahydromethanopterin reductase-like flavin-dependent oxidoreductase (luciferase family)